MIQGLVNEYMKNKDKLEVWLNDNHPEDYKELVTKVFGLFRDISLSMKPDVTKIHEIDDGFYQGTLLYLIPEDTYQPDKYYYVFIDYGSCSGCDTLEAINAYSSDKPTKQQVNEYMQLALNIVQEIKILDKDE